MVQFFKDYKNPFDEKAKIWREENEIMRTEIPEMQAKVVELEKALATEKRKGLAYGLYEKACSLKYNEESVSYNLSWSK